MVSKSTGVRLAHGEARRAPSRKRTTGVRRVIAAVTFLVVVATTAFSVTARAQTCATGGSSGAWWEYSEFHSGTVCGAHWTAYFCDPNYGEPSGYYLQCCQLENATNYTCGYHEAESCYCDPPPTDCYTSEDPEDTWEACDNVDHNGSGTCNDGCECTPGDTRTCPTGSSLGICTGGAIQKCTAHGHWSDCFTSGSHGQQSERCNGVDDDCDGHADDGLACPGCGKGADTTSTPGAGPMSSTDSTSCENCPGKPVDLTRGTVSTDVLPDLVLDDPIFPLRLTRRWTTEKALFDYARTGTADLEPEPTVLGLGWAHSFLEHIRLIGDTEHGGGSGSLVLVNADGEPVTFTYASGAFRPPGGGVEQISFGRLTYTLWRADGTKETFQAHPKSRIARLKTIDAGGVRLTATYYDEFGGPTDCSSTADVFKGRLCKVVTTNGRSLFFHYADLGSGNIRLTSVSTRYNDSDLIQYGYSNTECSRTDCDGLDLCCVIRGASEQENYHYFTSSSSTAPEPVPLLSRVDEASGEIVEKHTWTLVDGVYKVTTSETSDLKMQISYADSSCASGNGTLVTNYTAGAAMVPQEWCQAFDTAGNVSSVTGNCGCTSSQYHFGTGATRPLRWTLDKWGSRTTYDRDGFKRVRSMTVNDDDTDSDDTPPTDGTKYTYTYARPDGVHATTLLDTVTGPSADTGSTVTDSYTYGGPPPLVTASSRTGRLYQIGGAASIDGGYTNATLGQTIAYTFASSSAEATSVSAVTTTTSTGYTSQVETRTFYPMTTTLPNAKGRLHTIARVDASTSTTLTTSFGDSVSGCTAFGYDIFGHPYTITDPSGHSTCFDYDDQGRMTLVRRETDTSGTTFTYDATSGRLATVTQPDGIVVTYTYGGTGPDSSPAGLLIGTERKRTSNSAVLDWTTTSYISADLNRNLADEERRYSHFASEGFACSTSADCGGSGVTCDSGTSLCAPATCSGTGNSTCSTDGSSVCHGGKCLELVSWVSYGYDDQRRRNSATVHRHLTGTSPPNGTRLWAFEQTRPDSVAGHMTMIQEEVASSPNVQYLYDVRGRLEKVRRYVGTGMVTLVSYEYDDQDHVKTVIYYDTWGDEESRTTYAYDDWGHLVKVESPDAGTWKYAYDTLGNLMVERPPTAATGSDRLIVVYARDRFGRLTSKGRTNASGSWETLQGHAYDTFAGRTFTDCATGETVTWPDNGATSYPGREVYASDQNAYHYSYFDYGPGGEVTRVLETRAPESCTHVWTYGYASTPPHHLTSQTYPTGRTLTYTYDGSDPQAVNTITVTTGSSTTQVVKRVGYSAGRIGRVKLGNDVVNENAYFLDGSPRARTAKYGGSTLYSRTSDTIAADGSPLSLTTATGTSSYDEDFTYDATFRYLTDATGTGAPYDHHTFDYPATSKAALLGDRSVDVGYSGSPPVPNRHEYTYDTGTSRVSDMLIAGNDGLFPGGKVGLHYDASGNMTSLDFAGRIGTTTPVVYGTPESILTFEYDGEGNATKVGGKDYAYDSRHLRTVMHTPSGLENQFFYDDAGELLSETGCPNSTCASRALQDYVWLGGEPIAALVASQTMTSTQVISDSSLAVYYFHNGLLGEPMRATDSTRAVVWWGDHKPFGERVPAQSNTLTFNIGLPGQYLDNGGEGLEVYNWHRYYVPVMGRYVQSDPLSRAGFELSPYTYANSQPTNLTDPSGLITDEDSVNSHENPRIPGPPIDICRAHYGRNRHNRYVPYRYAKENWIKMSDAQSIYHRHGLGNENNEKYISPDGHLENVYRPTGELVTDPANEGTYNYSSPTDFAGAIGHFFVDVIPYWIWGNTPDDPTPLRGRVTGTP